MWISRSIKLSFFASMGAINEAGCLLEQMVHVYLMGKLCSVQGVVILGLIIQNRISKFKNLPAKGYNVCKHEKFQNTVWANRVSHFKLICTSLSHLHPSTWEVEHHIIIFILFYLQRKHIQDMIWYQVTKWCNNSNIKWTSWSKKESE